MSQSNNPRFWASQWYTTKFATEPWPGGWYWHDEHYNWFGPYESEHAAGDALTEHETSERDALDASDHIPSQFELYYHPLSPYSQKVLIAAYEKGAHFTPKIVNLMKSFSARRINHLRGRRSPVWQRGFHDHGIRTGEDLAATARYIVANPLRAGLVERVGDYPHWDAIWL